MTTCSDAKALLEFDALECAHGGPFQMALHASECVAVVGRSGSGKSVLLRLIADLDPHEGEAWLDGIARSSLSAPDWRRQVVYQAAEPAWWEPTARQHFPHVEPALLDELMSALGLARPLLDTEISRLSTGERQRMALARSLAAIPRVLLLDEPTSALDIASTLAVEAMLADRVSAGLAVLFVTHSREQAARVASRTIEVHARQASQHAA